MRAGEQTKSGWAKVEEALSSQGMGETMEKGEGHAKAQKLLAAVSLMILLATQAVLLKNSVQ